jgi:HTH-type transcriptional regulator/antitoxin HigA
MVDPEDIRHVPRILAECGVRFAIIETLTNTEIDGVYFWLDAQSPLIGMTCCHDRIDNFWFVLGHEIEHLLNKDGQPDQLSYDTVDIDLKPDTEGLPEEEVLANVAASKFCTDQDALDSFVIRKYPYMSEKDTLGLTRRLQRHPGIVVGQLQFKMARQYGINKYS